MTRDKPQSDTSALGFALFSATVMIAHQVAGKATRDALFLSHFDVTNLPKVVVVAALISLGGVLLMSRLLAHHGPAKLVPIVFGVSAALFVGEWALLGTHPEVASIILYLHMAMFGAILISGFWSVINERFDPHSAKRRIARIAAAATLGGIIGGILAQRVTAIIDVRAMLLVLSALHIVCAVSVLGIGKAKRSTTTQTVAEVRSGISILRKTTYLQWMGVLMVLIAIMAALLDYAFKAAASARYTSSEELVTFFAGFYAIVGAIAFLLQTLLGPKLLQRFGIGSTIAILPAAVFLLGMMGTVVTQLWAMVLVRGSHAVFANSFHRTSFELLYTPLPPCKKRPTKTIIDVASDRLGDMIGGGCLLLLLWWIPDLPSALIVGIAVIAAGAALYVVKTLHKGYVDQLAHSLQKGVVNVEQDQVVDATTQHILAELSAHSEREMLSAKIDAMHGKDGAEKKDEQNNQVKSEQFAQAVADLSAHDPDIIRRALSSGFMDIRLVPYLIPLLGNQDIADDARMELRWIVPRVIGQLTDALLDPELPLLARQRIPSVLESCHNPRSIEGLLQGLTDEEFNVRFSCARALTRMRSRSASLSIPSDVVFGAVQKEVDVESDAWKNRTLTGYSEQEKTDEEQSGSSTNHSLNHVFTVLGLVLDRDALNLSLHAIESTDKNLRGTALEYLENVLPDKLRAALWKHLEISQHGSATRRSHKDILSELKSFVSPK